MVGEGLAVGVASSSRLQITSYCPTTTARGHPSPCPSSPSSRKPSPPSRSPSAHPSSGSAPGSAAPASSSPTAASSPTPTTCAAARSPSGSPTAGPTRGTVKGVDWDGDLAVVEVDTAGAPALAWAIRRRDDRLRRVRRRRHPDRRRARLVRVRVVRGAGVPRPGRPPDLRARSSTRRRSRRARPASPLLDADGALVGLNTNRVGEGFYLALPADAALKARVDALPRRVARAAALGIAVAPAHVARRLRRSVGLPERDGVLVRGVEAGSPAEAAGIAEGDLLVGGRGPADGRRRRPPRGRCATPGSRSSSRSSAAPRSARSSAVEADPVPRTRPDAPGAAR